MMYFHSNIQSSLFNPIMTIAESEDPAIFLFRTQKKQVVFSHLTAEKIHSGLGANHQFYGVIFLLRKWKERPPKRILFDQRAVPSDEQMIKSGQKNPYLERIKTAA